MTNTTFSFFFRFNKKTNKKGGFKLAIILLILTDEKKVRKIGDENEESKITHS